MEDIGTGVGLGAIFHGDGGAVPHDSDSPVALVTGAARGIGRATVLRLRADGWRVIAFDRRWEPDDRLRRSAGIVAAEIDVRDASELEAGVRDAVSGFGRLDAAVANAAVGGPDSPLAETEWAKIREVHEINFVGAVQTALSASKEIIRTDGRGRIVFLDSLFRQQPVTGAAAYISSKGAVNAAMHMLALELAPRITVNAIAPGYIMTEMHREELLSRSLRLGTDLEAQTRAVRELIPMGRHGTAEDIAGGLAFLLSEDAAYITGQTISINGGVQLS